MFDGIYIEWNHKKIKSIIDHFGYKYFYFKKILDLGCGHGDIGAAFARLGSEVIAVDGRQEHLDVLKKKYLNIKTQRADLDVEWPFVNKKFDIVLDLGLICHLKNWEGHLNNVCKSANILILETEVSDSADPNFCIFTEENKSVYDWALNGNGSRPSAANIERVLEKNGMTFTRLDNNKLNAGPYKYDWVLQNSNERKFGHRRLWIAKKSNLAIVPVKEEIHNQNISININNNTNNNLSKYRVALCLSGHLRSFEATYKYLKENIINPTNCDIFIFSWDKLGYDGARGDRHLINQNVDENKIKQLYNPKKIIISKPIDFNVDKYLNRLGSGLRNPNIVSNMFYGINQSNNLKKEFENENNFKYDAVIRCRADLLFESKLDINEIASAKYNKGIFFPKFGDYGGLNDQFAFGNSESMDLYSETYKKLDDFFNDGCLWHAETLTKFTVDHFKLPILRSNINYQIKRSDGSAFKNAADNVQSPKIYPPPTRRGQSTYSSIKNFKIAVCISGHLRTFEQTYQSFYNNIIKNNANNCDVFIHTWETIGSKDSKMGSDAPSTNIFTVEKLNEINHIYNPKAIEIENYNIYNTLIASMNKSARLSEQDRNFLHNRNLISYSSMLYSMNKVKKLLEKYEEDNRLQYDMIIRLRPDTLFSNNIDIGSLIIDQMHIPQIGRYYSEGMNDQFAISNNRDGKIYLSLFDNILQYINNRECLIRPEVFLKYHLNKHQVLLSEKQINFNIIRPDSRVVTQTTTGQYWSNK